MKIWLINPYGPIHTEAWRDYRYISFGKFLAEDGHDVIWFTSNFSHHFKKFRGQDWERIYVKQNFSIILVPSISYTKNISIKRFLRDLFFSYSLFKHKKRFDHPDVIIYYETPFSFGLGGYWIGKSINSKLIFDQIDLWPEFFESYFHKYRSLISFLLFPFYAYRNFVNARLDGFIGLSQLYVSKPLKNLRHKPKNEVVYNGIDLEKFNQFLLAPLNHEMIKQFQIPTKQKGEVWAIFAGTLGPSYDVELILTYGKEIEKKHKNLKIFIAGSGPKATEVKTFVNNQVKNIYFLGFLPPSLLINFYQLCDIGLICYNAGSNVEMPDKFYDFSSAGLIMINSLSGEISEIIQKHNLGYNYKTNDYNDFSEKMEKILLAMTTDVDLKKNSRELATKFDMQTQVVKLKNLVTKIHES